jgi:GTPase SAR1 family protein
VPAEQLQLVIASNKTDLEHNRVVSKEQAEAFSLKFNAMHVETSAKDNVGIDDLFKTLGIKVQYLAKYMAADPPFYFCHIWGCS